MSSLLDFQFIRKLVDMPRTKRNIPGVCLMTKNNKGRHRFAAVVEASDLCEAAGILRRASAALVNIKSQSVKAFGFRLLDESKKALLMAERLERRSKRAH